MGVWERDGSLKKNALERVCAKFQSSICHFCSDFIDGFQPLNPEGKLFLDQCEAMDFYKFVCR